jgi:hypothetical protein
MRLLARARYFLLLLALVLPLSGLSCGSSLNEKEQAAVAELADYTNRSSNIDASLRTLGYQHVVSEDTWRQWSAEQKIEAAYRAAEAAAPGHGGDAFLARLSRMMAQRYDSAEREAALAPYLSVAGSELPLKFANPSAADSTTPVPARARDAIVVIADYTMRSPVGTKREILTRYGGLSSSDAADLLRTKGYEDALRTAIARKEPGQRYDAIRALAIAVGLRQSLLHPRLPPLPPLPPLLLHNQYMLNHLHGPRRHNPCGRRRPGPGRRALVLPIETA